MVSVIIPTYNEAETIALTLEHLRRARGNFELLVVDGESDDGTAARVAAMIPGFPRPLHLLNTRRNRALQLNHAAQKASGEALLFLHADVICPPEAVESLETALEDDSVVGGNFNLAFQGCSAWSRFFTWANRVRRWCGVYYGDSGICVRRDVFWRLGGFKSIPIMDDYEFVRRLESAGRTICLPPTLMVSDRRWKVQGVFRTLLTWVLLQALYSLGVPPHALARWYRPVRSKSEANRYHRIAEPAHEVK